MCLRAARETVDQPISRFARNNKSLSVAVCDRPGEKRLRAPKSLVPDVSCGAARSLHAMRAAPLQPGMFYAASFNTAARALFEPASAGVC